MAKQLFANNATGYLNSSITNVATSITLQSGQGASFPSPTGSDYFYATLFDGASTIEIVKVTARSVDTLTVVRAQEGTTAAAFASGTKFEVRITAAGLTNFTQKTGDTITDVTITTLTNLPTVTAATANTVPYFNGSKVVTSGSALQFNGTNFGINFTPSTWGAGFGSLQLGTTGSGLADNGFSDLYVIANCRYDGTNWKYISTDSAAYFALENGAFVWKTAASGTAGNTITFTQPMLLDASGNLVVGGTSANFGLAGRGVVEVNGSSTSLFGFNVGGTAKAYFLHDGTSLNITNQSASGTILFGNNGSERGRVDANGNWLVGQTGVRTQNSRSFDLDKVDGCAYVNHASGDTTGNYYVVFGYNGTNIGSISQNGTTAVAYNTSSDYRLKTNVRPADAKQFMNIQFHDFEWIDGRHDCGVIAHELQAIYPDLVIGEKDATVDGKPVYQQVNYIGLIGRMGAVIQNLVQRVAVLEGKV